MNLNEHLEKLEYKSRLKKKLIFGFGILVIIVSLIRFNDKIEREEKNKSKSNKTPKLFQVHQKNKDSLQREKTITMRIKTLDSINQLEKKELLERNSRVDKAVNELDEKLQKIKQEHELTK